MAQPLPPVARTAFTFPAAPMSPAIVAGMRGAMWATPASASDELVEALVADGSDAAVLAACVLYGRLPRRLNRPAIARAFQGLVARAQTEADANGLAWTPALDVLHGHQAYALDPDPAFPGREPARARLQRLIPWMAAWTAEDARAAFSAFASEAFTDLARAHGNYTWLTEQDADLLARLIPAPAGAVRFVGNRSVPAAIIEPRLMAWLGAVQHAPKDQSVKEIALFDAYRRRTGHRLSPALRDALLRMALPDAKPSGRGITKQLLLLRVARDPACPTEVLERIATNTWIVPWERSIAIRHPSWGMEDRRRLIEASADADKVRLALVEVPPEIVPWALLEPWIGSLRAGSPGVVKALARPDVPPAFCEAVWGTLTTTDADERLALARCATARAVPAILHDLRRSNALDVMKALLVDAPDDVWLSVFARFLKRDPQGAIAHLAERGTPRDLRVPASWLAPFLGTGTPEQNAQAVLALGACDADPLTERRPPRVRRPVGD